jgi:heterotetrameric sarcosine oxidase gamma subunit
MRDPAALAARSAFEGLLQAVGPGEAPGVLVRESAKLSIATVIARRGSDALSARIRSVYGIDLPLGPRRGGSDGIAFVGLGPCSWLAVREGSGRLSDELQRELADTAAVSDQSDGYAVMRLSGDKVRATFEKGLGVDLHPRAFRPGDAAVTACAHIGVILWQLDETPTYEIAVFRSLAAAFWHWLSESAAEFGVRVDAPR